MSRKSPSPPVLFQIASLLLRYPTAGLVEADPEIAVAVAELPGDGTRTQSAGFSPTAGTRH